MKYLLIALLGLVVIIFSITLGARNDQIVAFNFLVAQGQFRISTLMTSLFGAGFLLGWGICGLFWLRLRIQLAYTQRKVKRLQQQRQQEHGTTHTTDTLQSVIKE